MGMRTSSLEREISRGFRGIFRTPTRILSHFSAETRWLRGCTKGVVDSPRLGAGTFAPETDGGAQLRLLSEITESINLGDSVEGVFNLVYDRLRDFIPYNRIAIALADDTLERLSIVAARSDGKVVLGRGYAGVIAGSSLEPLLREGTIRILNDLQDYLSKKPASDSTRLIVREGMRSSLTLPLVVRGTPIGVVFFSSREPNSYRPEHADFLRSIVGHVAIAVERSRLMDSLKEKSEYLENVLQNSADAIAVVDARNCIRTWNEGAKRIFGYEASEVRGKDYSILVPPEERSSGEVTRVKERVEKDGFLKDYECVRLAKDGRRITVNVTSTLVRDKQGRIIGRSSIVRDVTHLKRLQQDLVTSQSLAVVGELAATIAHEIKNPLAGISGAIQVLRDAIPEDSGRREIVGEILDQITRLDNTVRDLLSFARPATPSRQELLLGDSLSKAWALLRLQPAASGVRFALEGADGVKVGADAPLLNQVWINLFQNAIEAMPKGGELAVRVTAGEFVRIEVHDSGTGIEPANAARLFKPFFSTKTRGTGLGLAITKKIIDAHGGSIRAESRRGQGTSIIVEIPS
jgi:two-component system, sporulation sensor kinase E